MCKKCAHNGRLMIAGVKLYKQLEASIKAKRYRLHLCLDLEARLLMAMSTRLRRDGVAYIDYNKLADKDAFFLQLLQDVGLDFEYPDAVRQLVVGCFTAQAKKLLADTMAWDSIFKVERANDRPLWFWKTTFIHADMATVETAKKYIESHRAADEKAAQERRARLVDAAQAQHRAAAAPAWNTLFQNPMAAPPLRPFYGSAEEIDGIYFPNPDPLFDKPAAPATNPTAMERPAHAMENDRSRSPEPGRRPVVIDLTQSPPRDEQQSATTSRETRQPAEASSGPRQRGRAHLYTPAVSSPLATAQSSTHASAEQPTLVSQPRSIVAHDSSSANHDPTMWSESGELSAAFIKASCDALFPPAEAP